MTEYTHKLAYCPVGGSPKTILLTDHYTQVAMEAKNARPRREFQMRTADGGFISIPPNLLGEILPIQKGEAPVMEGKDPTESDAEVHAEMDARQEKTLEVLMRYLALPEEKQSQHADRFGTYVRDNLGKVLIACFQLRKDTDAPLFAEAMRIVQGDGGVGAVISVTTGGRFPVLPDHRLAWLWRYMQRINRHRTQQNLSLPT